MNEIEPVDGSSTSIPVLPAERFSPDGLAIPDPVAVLAELGLRDLAPVLASAPTIRRGGVHQATRGVIQDPAGSAVGQPTGPSGGGASGAIYSTFPDLRPIPQIAPGAAVFNRSEGPGRRVLHTHSPRLTGRPASEADRSRTLADLANAYANALVAFGRRAGALGPDGTVLNLVPVSASIYAGAFASPRFGSGHLDPSYTITAILVALAQLAGSWVVPHRGDPPTLDLYYFADDVFAAAEAARERLQDDAG